MDTIKKISRFAVILVAGVVVLSFLPVPFSAPAGQAAGPTCSIWGPSNMTITQGQQAVFDMGGNANGFIQGGVGQTVTLNPGASAGSSAVSVSLAPPAYGTNTGTGGANVSTNGMVEGLNVGTAVITLDLGVSPSGRCNSGTSMTFTVTVTKYVPHYTPLQTLVANPLQLTYGTISAGGSIAGGSGGFSCSGGGCHTNIGTYNFNYSPSFQGTPTTIMSIYGNTEDVVSPNNEQSATDGALTFHDGDGGSRNSEDAGFSFLSVGPSTGGSSCAVVSPASNQLLIRGSVTYASADAYPKIAAGEGFTVTRSSPGVYDVQFLIPFASTPTVLVANNEADFNVVDASNVTVGSFTAFSHNLNNPSWDDNFSFIAIGTAGQAFATGCPVNTLESHPLTLVSGSFGANANLTSPMNGILVQTGQQGVWNAQYYGASFAPSPFVDVVTALATQDHQTAAFAGAYNSAPSTVSLYTADREVNGGGQWGSYTMPFEFFGVGPVASPTPTASLSASPTSITAGNSSTLTWSSTNAASCSGSWTANSLGANGTTIVTPAATTDYKVSCTGAGGTSPQAKATVTVTGGVTGTVTVTSENAVVPGASVYANWSQGAFTGSAGDPCNGSSCSGTAHSYPNMPGGSYQLTATPATITTQIQNYALRSVEKAPIVQKTKDFGLSFLSGLIPSAEAQVVCGYMNNNPTCPFSSASLLSSLSIGGNGDSANFIIYWNPIAAIGVSPSALPLSATKPAPTTGTVTVTNSGPAGSMLNWSASSNAPAWLTVLSPSSGSLGGGASTTLTLDANSSGLAAGTYTGTVTLSGSSVAPGELVGSLPTATVTITFTVSASGGSLAISPNPIPQVPVGTPVALTASGGSGNDTWTSGDPFNPQPGSGPAYSPSYPQPGTYAVTVKDSNGDQATENVTVVAPTCTLGANPPQIVPPQSSLISWNCGNAVACTLNGASVSPTIGSTSTSPTQTTTYILSCQGAGSGSSNTVVTQTTVTTHGPGVQEGNPGG